MIPVGFPRLSAAGTVLAGGWDLYCAGDVTRKRDPAPVVSLVAIQYNGGRYVTLSIDENIAAADVQLSREQLARIEGIAPRGAALGGTLL